MLELTFQFSSSWSHHHAAHDATTPTIRILVLVFLASPATSRAITAATMILCILCSTIYQSRENSGCGGDNCIASFGYVFDERTIHQSLKLIPQSRRQFLGEVAQPLVFLLNLLDGAEYDHCSHFTHGVILQCRTVLFDLLI